MMKDVLRKAIAVTFCTIILTGIIYPLVVTGLARIFFSALSEGSFVADENGKIIGSELIAQEFKSPAYFQPRPSDAGKGYSGVASGGSNLGPTSKELKIKAVRVIDRLKKENPEATRVIPVELVTSSASGLDPHLSPAGVFWQIPRVAAARRIDKERIIKVVESHIEGRTLGFIGEPRVNVLCLNLALDRKFGFPQVR